MNMNFVFRKLLYGIKQFNLEPKKGLKYLEESGFLENTPELVAKFLFRQERLSKKQIGLLSFCLEIFFIHSKSLSAEFCLPLN